MFSDNAEFMALGKTDGERVRVLLGRLKSSQYNESLSDSSIEFRDKFVSKVDGVFKNLPRPVDWQSFYQHDLKITEIPDDIKQWAAANKLNKSQTHTRTAETGCSLRLRHCPGRYRKRWRLAGLLKKRLEKVAIGRAIEEELKGRAGRPSSENVQNFAQVSRG